MDHHIPKGVFDILPEEPDPHGKWKESHLWLYIEEKFRKKAQNYGFREIRTPIFEHTELFKRSVGLETDIVSKEMYTFQDKGERFLTLRPEGTAAVMRAFIEKNLDQTTHIKKFLYISSMFRYERQQAGRYRQHHQLGIEAIGSPSPLQDVEIIDLLYSFLAELGLKNLTLCINSIGNLESRANYRTAFKDYLQPYLLELSEDSQKRFHTNSLRILDSKHPHDRKILQEAPSILDYLDPESKQDFECVCQTLESLDITFKITPSLVRGLDYYNRTVFEITSDALGAQNSLGGGGRYDGLLKTLGGPDLPAFGFGSGIERIIQSLIAQGVSLPSPPSSLLYFIPIGELAKMQCFKMLTQLRKEGLAVEMELNDRKLKNAIRLADQMKAHYICVIGENELQANKFEVKELKNGISETLSFEELRKKLKQQLKEPKC